MNAPSAVSISDMPAANSSGSESTARNGTWFVATPAEIASRPTSVAVSKPRPKSTPSGYICQLSRIRLATPADEEPDMRPRSCSRCSSCSSSSAPRAQLAEDADDVEQDEQVEDPDDPEERARDAGADVAAPVLERRDVRLHARRADRERRA